MNAPEAAPAGAVEPNERSKSPPARRFGSSPQSAESDRAHGWIVESRNEEAAGLVADWPGPDRPSDQRRFAVCTPIATALVLGSAQRASEGTERDAERAGIAIVRRRSGGGAVLVVPGEMLWAEAWIPVGDSLWTDDVRTSALWMGTACVRALRSCGLDGAEVHRGPPQLPPLSRQICMAGIAPGEVLVGGRKVAGISQRRSRSGARFQVAVLLRWRPEAITALLGRGDTVLASVRPAATGIAELLGDTSPTAQQVADALVDALP